MSTNPVGPTKAPVEIGSLIAHLAPTDNQLYQALNLLANSLNQIKGAANVGAVTQALSYLTLPERTTTVPVTANAQNDFLIVGDQNTGAVTLPDAASVPGELYAVVFNSTIGTLNVNSANVNQTVGGAAFYSITPMGGAVFQSDGSNWQVLASSSTGSQFPTRITNVNTAITAADFLVIADSSLALTFTLPLAAGLNGKIFAFKPVLAGGVTITAAAGDNIDGLGSLALTQNSAAIIQSTGTHEWAIIALYSTVSPPLNKGIRTTAISSTLTTADFTVEGTASGITLSLPSAASAYSAGVGHVFVLKASIASGTIAVNTGGGLIDGGAGYTLYPGESIIVQSDGTNYPIIGYIEPGWLTFVPSTTNLTGVTTNCQYKYKRNNSVEFTIYVTGLSNGSNPLIGLPQPMFNGYQNLNGFAADSGGGFQAIFGVPTSGANPTTFQVFTYNNSALGVLTYAFFLTGVYHAT